LASLRLIGLLCPCWLAVACASARIDDPGGRGTDDDAGGEDKDPPAGFPDAAVIVATPDAAPVEGSPDACSVQILDLLANGNFDSGAGVGWLESSTGGFALVLAEGAEEFPDDLQVPADSGAFLAYLGGYNGGTDEIHQDLALPADAVGLRLRGVVRVDTAETVQQPFDNAFIELQSAEGELLEELARLTNLDDSGDEYAPLEARANGDYQGQTVRLQIRITTDASLISHFFFDTLLLEVGTCTDQAARPR
jgi:hypothetical protein